MLLNPAHSSSIQAGLKNILVSKSLEGLHMVVDILDSINYDITAGAVVYDRFDLMREQLLVLETSASLFTKAYLRDVLYYTKEFQLTKAAENYVNNSSLTSHKLLTVCLRTKNFSFVSRDNLCRFEPLIEATMLEVVVNELDLVNLIDSIALDEPGLICLFRMANIIRQTGSRRLKTHMDKIVHQINSSQANHRLNEDDATSIINEFEDYVARSSTRLLNHSKKIEYSYQNNTNNTKLKDRIYNRIRKQNESKDWIASNSLSETYGSVSIFKDDSYDFNLSRFSESIKMNSCN